MRNIHCKNAFYLPRSCLLIFTLSLFCYITTVAQNTKPVFHYTVSMPGIASHSFHVVLNSGGFSQDSIYFKLPQWMPGYYQLMNYAKSLENFSAKDKSGKNIAVQKINEDTWLISTAKKSSFVLSYDIKTSRQFVANSFIDSSHAYIVPGALFLYADGFIKRPVTVKIIQNSNWNRVATGLETVKGSSNEFSATDFDVLYDSPLLIGNLEELPSFRVNGIEHRYIGYKMGSFDRVAFMNKLKKIVEASVAVIGDIPYNQYTFIYIGKGGGGIEHLNNTTVSFDDKGLNSEAGTNRVMNFLAHEYFHHYNVKRIRPLELGPFDYQKENRTNLLWVSEGISVYYEYMITKRAGICTEHALFNNFENNINNIENNPGRLQQSLIQASYETWSDGPFGNQGKDSGKAISYYEKGPLVGLMLDLAILHSTHNQRSLDDVMRLLYQQYYKKWQRGFTDAEFQQACENVAGTSLTALFEYVYTTRELDYDSYLQYAGLKLERINDPASPDKKFVIKQTDNISSEQSATLQAWLGKR